MNSFEKKLWEIVADVLNINEEVISDPEGEFSLEIEKSELIEIAKRIKNES